jgi:hypothetical protein
MLLCICVENDSNYCSSWSVDTPDFTHSFDSHWARVLMGRQKRRNSAAIAGGDAASAPRGSSVVAMPEMAPPPPPLPPNSWRSVVPPLLPSTLAVIDKLGFASMTPVQAAVIPLFRQNKDVCVEVRT